MTGAAHEELAARALALGATRAAVIPATSIPALESIAHFCEEPRCSNHGLSAGCPPAVGGPEAMREMLRDSAAALVFQIDVPTSAMQTDVHNDIFRLLHETAAKIEDAAASFGYRRATAFASGGCKFLFCEDEVDCAALKGEGCRHPEIARESMSGYGVDVAGMVKAAGWSMNWVSDGEEISPMVGLVLLR